ncbi:uncharacterized protein K452DRAFT_93440 [Aplosporella prunicola CBS 121167]|uniref:Uncharacterized protein n=1 Tax=Aplosporella prunicola CBS 121167 TaxID=1176127 RepID=A0A6A6B2D1_9PEZI|nr:uncharacterized protein K452DRAFT_93440 [Aplosporella prunicola CBS 121167]KAF2137976.1 hypothetical protein K452DRAFT_93440 [Aplosporella prunicola CBS 121167]
MKQASRHAANMEIQASTWRTELQKGVEKRIVLECETSRLKLVNQDLERQLSNLMEKIKDLESSVSDTNSQSISMWDANIALTDELKIQNKMLSARHNSLKLPIKRKISEIGHFEGTDKDTTQLQADVARMDSLNERLRDELCDGRRQVQCTEKKAATRKTMLQGMKKIINSLSNKTKVLTELVSIGIDSADLCVAKLEERVLTWIYKRCEHEFNRETRDPEGELHALEVINREHEVAMAESTSNLKATLNKLRESVD